MQSRPFVTVFTPSGTVGLTIHTQASTSRSLFWVPPAMVLNRQCQCVPGEQETVDGRRIYDTIVPSDQPFHNRSIGIADHLIRCPPRFCWITRTASRRKGVRSSHFTFTVTCDESLGWIAGPKVKCEDLTPFC